MRRETFRRTARWSTVLTSTCVTLWCCRGNEPTQPERSSTVIVPQAAVVDSQHEPLVSDSTQQAAGEYRLLAVSGDTAIKVGRVIVGGQRGGFLRRVTSVLRVGDTLVLGTTQAALTDVVTSGSLTIADTASRAAGREPRPGVMWGIPWVESAAPGVTLAPQGLTLDGVVLYSGQACSGGGASQSCATLNAKIVSGTVDFVPQKDIALTIAGGQVQTFNAVVGGTVSLAANLALSVSGQLSYSADKEIAVVHYPFVACIGAPPCLPPVGIPVFGDLAVEFHATISAAAEASITTTVGATGSVGVQLGARYQNGEWSPVFQLPVSFSAQAPTIGALGSVAAKLYVRPDVTLSLYGVAGPYMALGPYLRFADSISQNRWAATLAAAVEAQLGFNVHVLDWTLADYSKTFSSAEQVLWQGGGSILGVPAALSEVSGNKQTGPPGAQLRLPLVVRVTDAGGSPVGGVTVSWAVAAGGGSVGAATSNTDTLGDAETTWTLGPTAGINKDTVTATLSGAAGSPVTFTASVGSGPPTGVATIGEGFNSTCAITGAGAAYCWGANGWGVFGNGNTTGSPLPVAAAGGMSFAALSVGFDHVCGLTSAGQAYCWGASGSGNLGNGSQFTTSLTPVPVSGGYTFTAISAGYLHTCGISDSGAAYCWGDNGYGELGNGTTTTSLVPVAVSGNHVFRSISAGAGHTCGVTSAGTAYCWGDNQDGELGVGSTSNDSVPVEVSGNHVFASISAGYQHTCGVTTDSAAYCWGLNGSGQVGSGTSSGTDSIPTAVISGVVFASISAGRAYTCGLTAAGAGYCWGAGDYGQLGNGSLARSSTPAPVLGGFAFKILTAGSYDHTCGITLQGAAYCWGLNGNGQLGNGSTAGSSSPVEVLGGITWSP